MVTARTFAPEGHWSFQVAKPDYFAPCKDDHAVFRTERYYGKGPSAGWMSMDEASDLLEEAIAEFRRVRLNA
jgi:hypothetical protein